MSLEIVNSVYARGGFDLSTKEGCGVFTEAVVIELRQHDADWGHIRKSGAQNHVVDPQGNWHAVDALMHRNDGAVFDIVSDSESVNARPSWQTKGTAPVSLWYAPGTGVSSPSTPAPTPQPPAPAPVHVDYSGDIIDIKNKLDNLSRLVEELVVRPQPAAPEIPAVKFPNYSGSISIPYLGNRSFTLKPE